MKAFSSLDPSVPRHDCGKRLNPWKCSFPSSYVSVFSFADAMAPHAPSRLLCGGDSLSNLGNTSCTVLQLADFSLRGFPRSVSASFSCEPVTDRDNSCFLYIFTFGSTPRHNRLSSAGCLMTDLYYAIKTPELTCLAALDVKWL